MKSGIKLMLVLILFLAVSCGAFSQNSPDSITSIPNRDLRAALKIINNLRTDSIIKDRDMRVLQATIKQKDQTVTALKGRIETYRLLSDNYKKEASNLSKQIELKDKINNDLSRQVRKEKTKTVIAWITGAAVTAFSIYLTTK